MTQPRTARRHHGRVEAHPAETGRLRLLQLSATNAVTLERDRRLLLCGLVVSGVVRGREAHGAGDAPTLDLAGGGTAPGADPRQPRDPRTPPDPATSSLVLRETRSETSAVRLRPALRRRRAMALDGHTQRSPGPKERPGPRRSGHVPRPQPHGGHGKAVRFPTGRTRCGHGLRPRRPATPRTPRLGGVGPGPDLRGERRRADLVTGHQRQ